MLRREPGGQRVIDSLGEAAISTVNLAEVLEQQRATVGPAELAAELLTLGIEFVPATDSQAVLAAEFKAIKVKGGLSLGDRFCLALGHERRAKVLTADKVWVGLPHGVDVESIR